MAHRTPWEFRTMWSGRRPQDHGTGPDRGTRQPDDRREIRAALVWDTADLYDGPSNLPEPPKVFRTRAELAATVPAGIVHLPPPRVDPAPRPAPSSRPRRPKRPTSAPVITAGELNAATRRGPRASQAPVDMVSREALLRLAKQRRNGPLVEHILATYPPGALIPVPAQ